jgi:hypothetical protein
MPAARGRAGAWAVRLSITAANVIAQSVAFCKFRLSASADLCKQVSTKGNGASRMARRIPPLLGSFRTIVRRRHNA